MADVDPREVYQFEEAVRAFQGSPTDANYVTLVQAGRRLVLILRGVPLLRVRRITQRVPAPVYSPTGNCCSQCGGVLVRTGTCETCQSCGWNGGCS